MPPPAACTNCPDDSSSSPPTQQEANLGVVLGVLGGLCLVALVVVVVVPLVRRRVRRRQSILSGRTASHSYRKARTSDIEDEMYLPSRRPSFLHQKMFPGPDEKPLLKPLILDPLRPISALTWSNLRFGSKSPSSSTDHGSDELAHPDSQFDLGIADPADQVSLSTDRAQNSHRTMSKSTKSSHGTAGAVEDEARSSLPSLQRSPTPPGLPSKRGSPAVSARRASLPITPISPPDSSPSPSRYGVGPGMPFFAPTPAAPPPGAPATPYNPLSPVSPQTASTSSLARSGSYAPSITRKGPGMDPVPEDADADEYAETRSLQLPSPPASPDQSDARWSNRRPSLAGRQSAPNALPFRPRSSTGPSVALPLTAAFQTSVLRSGSTSSSSNPGASSQVQRYPSITTSPPPRTRSRPSSVSVPMSGSSGSSASTPSPAPEGDIMARPTEAFRRMSTSDVRHRQPYSNSAREDDPIGRAYLRSSNALQVPEVREAGPGHSSYRHAMVYNPPPQHGVSRDGPTFTTPPPNPLSPVSPIPATHTPSSSARRLSVSTSHTSQHSRPPGMGAPHPPTVTWKSLASGSRSSLSSHQSHLRDPTRSRSNSVRSTRTLPSQLPPLDPVTPLSLSLDGSPESENEGNQ
ncbi:hypothetical protein C8T65DRAFT_738269 [Cerioporus squamosus]|nr:hypothetical protein C8T65DRAFT_738269 [Cerioporus squamosus]